MNDFNYRLEKFRTVDIPRAGKSSIPKAPKNARLFKAPKSDELTMENSTFLVWILSGLEFFGAFNVRRDGKSIFRRSECGYSQIPFSENQFGLHRSKNNFAK